jgi:hypothetical protein
MSGNPGRVGWLGELICPAHHDPGEAEQSGPGVSSSFVR